MSDENKNTGDAPNGPRLDNDHEFDDPAAAATVYMPPEDDEKEDKADDGFALPGESPTPPAPGPDIVIDAPREKYPRDPFALPVRRRRKLWPKILAGAAILLVLLAVFAPKLIPSRPLCAIAETKLAEALGGRPVHIDAINLGWWSGVRVSGLSVDGATPGAPPLLTLERLDADAKILPLLSMNVENFMVRVQGLRLRAAPADLALLSGNAAAGDGETPATPAPAPDADAAWRLDWLVPEL